MPRSRRLGTAGAATAVARGPLEDPTVIASKVRRPIYPAGFAVGERWSCVGDGGTVGARGTRVHFRLFGPLEIVDGDHALSVGRSKRGALLTLLLIDANEVLSVDRLIEELWGETPPATAAKSLQVYVSQLRRDLRTPGQGGNGEVLRTRGHGYVLEVDADAIDIRRFERLLAEAQRALAADDPRRAAQRAREALALWRGPALADFAYHDFAQREIARLEELRLLALETEVEAGLALGEHARLAGMLESLVRDYPLREGVRAHLMLALYRCGRQAEALAVYRDGCQLLRDELGIEPKSELRELERKILEQSPELAPPKPQGRGVRGAPQPPAASPGSASGISRWPWLALRGHGTALIMVGAVLLLAAALGALREVVRDNEATESGKSLQLATNCSPVSYGGVGRPDFLIASVLPRQGPSSVHGTQTAQALSMVLEQRKWRAGNYTVGLQLCDEVAAGQGGPSAERCRRNAHAFVRNRRVLVVVGPLFSACAGEMLAILNRAPGGPLPVISGSNTYLGLTRAGAGVAKGEPERHYPTGRRHYVRLVASDDAQGAALALYAKKRGARHVFVLDDDEAYGYGLAEAFRVAGERSGMLVVGRAQWNPEAGDYRALAARVRRAGADATFLGGLPTNNGFRLIKDLREELGRETLILAPDAFNQEANLVNEAGGAAEGVVVASPVLPNRALPPAGRAFADRYEDRFSTPLCCYTMREAQALRIALDAVAKSDGTRAQVLEKLFETRVENGLLGDFHIDRYGDTTQRAIGVYRIEDGRLRFAGAITAGTRQ
jgi:DNA-binding SARP family transcriptional activator/ABC-type branched-subunit amino acid transport system substrate-binding protein